MRVVVIEDELPAGDKLSEFIHRYDRQIKIVARLESVKDSFVWFNENRAPDLVFSDIELLDGNVFRLYENGRVACPTIFTTAYDQFWLQAFERNGIAYLLKPFAYEKFVAAMQKFESLRQNFVSAQQDFWHKVQANLAQPNYKERLIVKVKGGIRLLETNQIAFIKTQDEIPFAFDAEGNKFPLKENLTELEQILDPKTFFRLNRSEIVNLNFIERLEPDFRDRLVVRLRNLNIKLVSSTNRTPNLRKWLESL
ncbi:MAG TPA: LytTR family DNA-binding domain-containing protein [Pyrinomonadaceae bacterium]|jgi:DNA-binding LytR/AlgR family response regulator